MSNKANQESICTNGTLNILQSPQGAENRAGTQTLVDTSAEQKGRDLYIQAESCHDRAAPPAEQQATKETSGGFHVWRDISTAPKDGSRFVAIGYNYGLYSEGRHICVAQWFRGCWMETSDWNEASELQHLTHWLPLPSPPDDVAAPAEQQAAPKAAPVKACVCGESQTSGTVHRVDGPCYVAAPKEASGEPDRADATNLARNTIKYPDLQLTAKGVHCLAEAVLEMDNYIAHFVNATPQQEASQDTMYLLRRLLSNQHTLTGPEFRAELEKIVGETYQQEAQEPCPTCVALARTVMLDQVSFDRKPDCYGIRQITDDESVEEWEDIRTSPDVAREEANDMMATGRGEIYEVVPLYATPQPAPAPLTRDQIREVFMAHGFTIKEGQTDLKQYVYDAAYALLGTKPAPLGDDVVKDAARYRWLRDTSNADDPSHMIALHIRDEQNDASLSGIDAAIDAALAAQGDTP